VVVGSKPKTLWRVMYTPKTRQKTISERIQAWGKDVSMKSVTDNDASMNISS